MVAMLPDLSKVPRHAYSFLWADYVELLCLCGRNGLVSKGNIDASTQEAGDVQADSVGDPANEAQSEEVDDQV